MEERRVAPPAEELGAAAPEPGRPPFDPASLPLPYMSRRRVGQAAGLLVAVWLVIAFGRQAGDANAASTRADDLRAQNAALRDQVAALQGDLGRVEDDRFIQIQARAQGLGGPGEVPFTLEAGAPTPGPEAPGSAAVRLGAPHGPASPLDAWLEALFGPGS